MSKDIQVRKAQLADAQFIADANYAMALETENFELDKPTVLAGVKAVFLNDARGSYMVTEVNGQVVGCLLLTYEWSDWRNKQTAWIQSLYVLPQFRGLGAFKAMFKKVEERVESGEFAGVRLYVDSTNTKAQDVYSKLGMNGEHYKIFEKMND
ncbi:MAG: GNAT family N-acetyltransferase [Lentisphaerales bacterium]|nr:GNAT family N-acetyltransferase [Lentisphaerales bacterium]